MAVIRARAHVRTCERVKLFFANIQLRHIVDGTPFHAVNNLCVYLRTLNRRMPKYLAHCVEIRAIVQQHRGARVAAHVEYQVLLYPGTLAPILQVLVDDAAVPELEYIVLTSVVALFR